MIIQRHRKNLILFTLLVIILVMTIGYSSLSQYLTINGTSNITSDFKVVFTSAVEGTLNKATTETLDKTETEVTFTTVLRAPGSSAEYIVTVQNQGKLDAYLESIEGIDEANSQEPSYVRFKVKDLFLNDRLNVGESKTFRVIVTYDVAATELSDVEKTLTLKLNFTQNSGNAPEPDHSLTNYLISNELQNTVADGSSGLVAIDNNGEITTSSSPREYRYIGSNPNNYVYFNTYSGDEWSLIGIMDGIETTLGIYSTSDECEIQKQQVIEGMGESLPEGASLECVQTGVSGQSQLWRIIGIFDGKLKLIKNESIGNYSWDNKPSGTGSSTSSYGSNDWSDSALQEVLNNGPYYNRTSGTCPSDRNGATTACDFSSNGLTEEAKLMIELSTWKLGGSSTNNDVTAQMFYERERGTTVYSGRPTEWVGYIGLMYPSDYGFATSGGSTTGRSSCLAKELYSWDSSSYSDCKNNSWLFTGSYQWTLAPDAGISSSVFDVGSSGDVSDGSAYGGIGVRPSLNLKSDTVFVSGTGTKEDPYVIG